MNYEVSDIVSFKDRKFEVVENLIRKSEKKHKKSFWMGAFSIAFFVVVFIGGFVAIRLLHYPTCISVTLWTFLALIGGYIVYLFVHELLQGLILLLSRSIKLKDLSFGVVIRAGAVYCISKVPVRITRMRVALLIPFFLISVPLLIYSIVSGDIIFLIASALSFTINAADLWYLGRLARVKSNLFLLEEKTSLDTEEPQGYILKEIL